METELASAGARAGVKPLAVAPGASALSGSDAHERGGSASTVDLGAVPGTSGTEVVVVVPTYNEVDNLPRIYERLRGYGATVGLLVVDDDSPDGTGRVADGLAAHDPHMWVLHRPGKSGLGRAYVDGMLSCLRAGAKVVVEMDADGSHQPEELGRLTDAIAQGADVAIGSRYVGTGTVLGWARHRSALSRAGNLYARRALAISVRDLTSGFRAYTTDALRSIDVASIRSEGYAFQIEMAFRAVRQGLRVVEVPITFVERQTGTSKMSVKVALEALWRVPSWRGSGGSRSIV